MKVVATMGAAAFLKAHRPAEIAAVVGEQNADRHRCRR